MHGETNLENLLSSMSPSLMQGEFVFCSFDNAQYGEHAHLDPIAVIKESEGLTFVISKQKADEYAIAYASTFKGITLEVHSSLEAVGLTAAFSRKLTDHGISANVIAGYYHDHIFVQSDMATLAMLALKEFNQ